jgi:hypothetical protein
MRASIAGSAATIIMMIIAGSALPGLIGRARRMPLPVPADPSPDPAPPRFSSK